MIREFNLTKEELKKLKYAKIELESGDIWIELFFNDAPNTVANFAYLAKSGFYRGLRFHRVIKDFVAQGGCPNSDGTGGPGYEIKDEVNKNKHSRGSIAMAHRGPNTAGSQFYICFKAQPHLDNDFTVFGKINEDDETSFKTLDSIQNGTKIVDIFIYEKRN